MSARCTGCASILSRGWPRCARPTPSSSRRGRTRGSTCLEDVIEALRAAHRARRPHHVVLLGRVCPGATGLLDGRRATTHWAYVDEFAERFPEGEARPRACSTSTTATSSPPPDRRPPSTSASTWCGWTTAPRRPTTWPGVWSSRPTATAARRSTSTNPWPQAATTRPRRWFSTGLLAHLDQPLAVEDLAAQRAAMSSPDVRPPLPAGHRHDPASMAAEPARAARPAAAETTGEPVEVVARDCGFGTAAALRIHFQRVVGTVAPGLPPYLSRGSGLT